MSFREYRAINACELLPNQGFTFEDSPTATVFAVVDVHTYFYDIEDEWTEIELSHSTKFVMPAGNRLYLVRFPEWIRADAVLPGDRYVDSDGRIYPILSVHLPSELAMINTNDSEWRFLRIGDNRYFSHRDETMVSVYRNGEI